MTEQAEGTQPQKRTIPWWVVALILLGVAIIAFFGMRAYRAATRFRAFGPPQGGRPGLFQGLKSTPGVPDLDGTRDWMTVPFIAHTFHLPGKVIFDKLGIPQQGNEKKSLVKLNGEYFPTKSNYVLGKVKDILREHLGTPAAATPTP